MRTVTHCEICGAVLDAPVTMEDEDETFVVCTPCYEAALEEQLCK